MELEKNLIYYILKKQNDLHPFRISRILLLFELEYSEKFGKKPTSFVYRLHPSAFYIENFTTFFESMPYIQKVKIKDEKGTPIKGFLRLTSPEISVEIPEEMASILDRIIEQTRKLSDHELNRLVVESEKYKKLGQVYK
jgi:hypothetical protein